jgi:invasion protein IalB
VNASNAHQTIRSGARVWAIGLTAITMILAAGTAALAQAPPAAAPAPKAAPKQLPKAAPQPKQAPQAAEAQQGQPQLTFAPWTKICTKGPEANSPQVCFIGKDGHVETGQLVVAAVLIEPEGADQRKILRITLPLGMALQPGTRVIVDQGQPMNAPYIACVPQGCLAEYEASGELIDKMRKGQGLVVQGVNGQGQGMQLVLPLAEFAKAHDGPPLDEKAFAAQQQKLQEELQRKAAAAAGQTPPAAH